LLYVSAVFALDFTLTGILTHSPRQPDVSLGYIYPAVVHHGAKVYLSAEQWRWSESSYATTGYFALFISAATGAFFLNRRWRLLGYDHDA